jgi:N-acetyl-1-D-myo-inositol-2-amino-2-deoxy-alpha-D-glucopyranoside deacetylase
VQKPALVQMQTRALAQYATQVVVYEGYYALSNHIAGRLSGREGFAVFDPVAGQLVPASSGSPQVNGLLGNRAPRHVQGHR